MLKAKSNYILHSAKDILIHVDLHVVFFISLSRHLHSLHLHFLLTSGDQIINDVSPILNKQVTINIIVGGWVGLWGGSVVTSVYIYFICIQETSSIN